jgi:hypothetical protein
MHANVHSGTDRSGVVNKEDGGFHFLEIGVNGGKGGGDDKRTSSGNGFGWVILIVLAAIVYYVGFQLYVKRRDKRRIKKAYAVSLERSQHRREIEEWTARVQLEQERAEEVRREAVRAATRVGIEYARPHVVSASPLPAASPFIPASPAARRSNCPSPYIPGTLAVMAAPAVPQPGGVEGGL